MVHDMIAENILVCDVMSRNVPAACDVSSKNILVSSTIQNPNPVLASRQVKLHYSVVISRNPGGSCFARLMHATVEVIVLGSNYRKRLSEAIIESDC